MQALLTPSAAQGAGAHPPACPQLHLRTLSKYLREPGDWALDAGMARRKQGSMDTHNAYGGLLPEKTFVIHEYRRRDNEL